MNLFNPNRKTTMKTSTLVAAIVAGALSAPIASAQEKTPPAKPTMNMDMGKPAPEKSAPAKPAMGMDMDKQMPQMQEKMKAMQAQMDKIHKTTDPKEREKLLKEHLLAMQDGMKSMRGMGGPMMMGDKKGGMKEGDKMKRDDMTEKRMDMMQMMMEQMLQRDQVMEAKPHM